MNLYSPKNFKNKKYLLGKYSVSDLIVLLVLCGLGLGIILICMYIGVLSEETMLMIIGCIIGGLLICTGLVLTMPMSLYHNILCKIKIVLNYNKRNKKYIWYGVDYNNYED